MPFPNKSQDTFKRDLHLRPVSQEPDNLEPLSSLDYPAVAKQAPRTMRLTLPVSNRTTLLRKVTG